MKNCKVCKSEIDWKAVPMSYEPTPDIYCNTTERFYALCSDCLESIMDAVFDNMKGTFHSGRGVVHTSCEAPKWIK